MLSASVFAGTERTEHPRARSAAVIPAFSVQFHPEAHGGPLDTSFLFDRFLKMMDDNKK